MASVGFDGEVASQPTELPDCCGAVNRASVPRKLRSALEKRGRESITPPMSVSKRQCHLSNRVDAFKKEGAKKSMQKKGHVTKDEKEVAETLYALANMVTGSDKAIQLGLNDEPIDMKPTIDVEEGSMTAVEDTRLLMPRKKSRKISSEVTLEATCQENLLDSKAQSVKLKGVKKTDLSSSKQSSSPFVSRLLPRVPAWLRSTNFTSKTTIIRNCISTEKCSPVVVQSNKTWKRSSAHVYVSCLIKVLQISEIKERSPQKPVQLTYPGWDQQTTVLSDILRHERLIQNHQLASEISSCSGTKECSPVVVQSNKTWRRSSAHVYISRLIKVLQISERKEGSPEKLVQLSYPGWDQQMTVISDILRHERLIQEHRLAETSATKEQDYGYLCMGTEIGGLDPNESLKQFQALYMQPQNHSSVHFSLPQSVYSSTLHAHRSALAAQALVPQYLTRPEN